MNYFALIAQLIRDQAEASGMQLQDAAREFLAANTERSEGEWWKEHADDLDYVAEHVYKTAIGDPDAETATLLCGNMVNLFNGVCGELGLASRTIWLYSDYPGYVMGHTYIEIYNTETGKWEIQDANYNTYFTDIRTGERIGVKEMFEANDVENFIPRNASASGWEETGAEGLRLGNFFAAQMITTENELHTNSNNVTHTLIPGIAEELKDNEFSFKVVNHIGNPLATHLTEHDATFANGRATIVGGDGEDFLSYDGGAGTFLPILIAGAGNDTLTLRMAAGQLYGNAGDDILVGGVYADILSGGVGADVMAGGGGNDRYIVQLGDGYADVIEGFGVGVDHLVLLNALGSGAPEMTTLTDAEFALRFAQLLSDDGLRVRYDITGDGIDDGEILLEGYAKVLEAKDVEFSFKADPLAGFITAAESSESTSYAEVIYGGTGTDRILYSGTQGAILAGSKIGYNSGDDSIQSRSDADCSLSGQDGNDVLVGGGGDDFISGGAGNDALRGQDGNDFFVFGKNAGSDTIADFTSPYDTIYIFGWSSEEKLVQQTLEDDGLLLTYDLNGDGTNEGSIKLLGQAAPLVPEDFLFG